VRQLLNAIEGTALIDLRDRALIGFLLYTFARVGAVIAMNVEDYYPNGKRWFVRLHEKGGKQHELPAHHKLDEYMDAYLTAAAIGNESATPLFRTAFPKSGLLTERRMRQSDVWRMIRRRAVAAGIMTPLGCHTFRATGITNYLRHEGTLEKAQNMACHESARTTGLYDRRSDAVTLEEIERVRFDS
jgi:integrase/recombinase XerD